MSKHCKWRKVVKKLQRKRRRKTFAINRERKAAEEEADRLKNPFYQQWLLHEADLETEQVRLEQEQHDDAEEKWLRQELLAQKKYKLELQERAAKEAVELAARQKELQAYEAQQAVELERLAASEHKKAEAIACFELKMQMLEKYAEETHISTPPMLLEFMHTRPEERVCEFYDRTNCCKFGTLCNYNHKKPFLSNILLIQHLFQHPLLDMPANDEYARADAHLELNERDLRIAYDEFFADVMVELEKHGVIRNLRTVRNTLSHLRGHVFVQYERKSWDVVTKRKETVRRNWRWSESPEIDFKVSKPKEKEQDCKGTENPKPKESTRKKSGRKKRKKEKKSKKSKHKKREKSVKVKEK